MVKYLLTLLAFVVCTIGFVKPAGAAPTSCSTSSLNCSSYILFDTSFRSDSDKKIGQTVWDYIPQQPIRSFHRVAVKNTSGQSIEMGYGTYAGVVRHLLIPADTGASAQTVVYPFGLSYAGTGSSIWIRGVSGVLTSGELTVNFLY